ncbi:MAG: phosphate ABC transporter permease PstA [Actinomycetota bacterium]
MEPGEALPGIGQTLLAIEPLPPELAAGAPARRQIIRQAARRSLPRRKVTKNVARILCGAAVVASLLPLVALATYTLSRGLPALNLAFFVHNPTPPGEPGGGILNAVVGTVLIGMGMGALMAVPLGVVVALFLLERRGKLAVTVRFGAGVLAGLPSIAIGIFAYTLVVQPLAHFSALAGAFAIGVLMLPIVIRSSEAAMRAVPTDLREAAVALGARRGRVARSVVLRGALGGLVTGGLLALARAMGETAPLLFTTVGSDLFNMSPFQPTAAMPLLIFSQGTQALPGAQETAWGTALVLLSLVLLLSIVARVVAGRLTRANG